jgi:hypothetical protein
MAFALPAAMGSIFSAGAPAFGAAQAAGGAAAAGAAGAGAAGAAGLGGMLSTGLSALGGPVGLGIAGINTLASIIGGQQAEQAMQDMRTYQFGSNIFSKSFDDFLDFNKAKNEIALANSPQARQLASSDFRKDLAGKYADPFTRSSASRFSGSSYG